MKKNKKSMESLEKISNDLGLVVEEQDWSIIRSLKY
jgi:hypothetical protein